jgi:hypothetical protein
MTMMTTEEGTGAKPAARKKKGDRDVEEDDDNDEMATGRRYEDQMTERR